MMFQTFLKLDPIWLSLAPLILINLAALSTLPIFAYFKYKNPGINPMGEVANRHHSKIVGVWLKEYWYWMTAPIEQFAIKWRLSPNFFTVLGFLVSLASGFAFYFGKIGIAGWFIILGGTCDIIDGRIARKTRTGSSSGAFFDSVMDRYGEIVCLFGLIAYYRNHWMLWVVLAAIMGSVMVSYNRARGQAVGVDCDRGPMQRAERIVYLGVASIFSEIFAYLLRPYWVLPGAFLTSCSLVVIAVLTNFTALYRLIWVYRGLLTKSAEKTE